MSDSDGVEESLTQTMRTAITAAARVGETLARVRQQHQQQAAAQSAARAREVQARLEAQVATARASYRGVDDPQWWTTASPEDIASTYRHAAAWRDLDPEAARVERRIAEELRTRYEVDVRSIDTAALGSHLSAAAAEMNHRAVLDMAQASALLEAAERADQKAADAHELEQNAESPEVAERASTEVEHQQGLRAEADEHAELAWDSAERREATARELSARVPDPQAVEAKMRADLAQGRPVTEATRVTQGRGPKARPGLGAATRLRQQQPGLTR